METLIFSISVLLLLLMGFPVAFALLIVAVYYIIFLSPFPVPLIVIPQLLFRGINSFTLLAVPFYLFLGVLMGKAGITKRLVDLSSALVGHMYGALAQVNIVASVLFAGIQGSATADSAMLGSLLIPAMREDGYDDDFSAAITAASSIVGPIIPPSIIMIIYSSVTGISIGKLFLAGYIPGILYGISLMILSYFLCRRKHYGKHKEKFSFKHLWVSFYKSAPTLLIPVIILGGILGGIVTATEAGVGGIVVVLFLGIFLYRNLTLKILIASIYETIILIGSVMLVVAASQLVGWVFLSIRADEALKLAIFSIVGSGSAWIIAIVLFVAFVAGCFVDSVPIIIILAPMFAPIVEAAGFDIIHFSIMFILVVTSGLMTPPVGICVFTTCKIANVSIMQYTKRIIPFYLVFLVTVIIIFLFPLLSLWLPNLVLGR